MNQKIEIENRNQQMNWGIEMENRNCVYGHEELISGIWIGICIGLLISALIFGIFGCGFGFEIDFGKSNSENEIQNSGRLPGDDVEASGFAGNWNEDFYNENEIEILDLAMVEYSHSPFFNLTDADRKTIQYIVAGEAKGEPMEGKMAVAQCILHGMVKSDWSAERVRIEYQYSGWDDELENVNPEAWAEVVEAVSRVFDDGELISDKPILYFYAPNITSSSWHESLNHAVTIEGHRFFYLDEDVNADWFLNLRKDV